MNETADAALVEAIEEELPGSTKLRHRLRAPVGEARTEALARSVHLDREGDDGELVVHPVHVTAVGRVEELPRRSVLVRTCALIGRKARRHLRAEIGEERLAMLSAAAVRV